MVRVYATDSSSKKGLSVAWRDLDVTFPASKNKGSDVHAVRRCSGGAAAGRLTALMGPAGSGKTTLLNCLAHRDERPTAGAVRFIRTDDHMPLVWTPEMRSQIGFVPQSDIVFERLTVRQSLEFSASLRLPASMSGPERTERVGDVMTSLHLSNYVNTLVGDTSSHHHPLSSAERKRLCIATELLTEVRMLLLDEPTSGFDAAMAVVVIDALASLAKVRT